MFLCFLPQPQTEQLSRKLGKSIFRTANNKVKDKAKNKVRYRVKERINKKVIYKYNDKVSVDKFVQNMTMLNITLPYIDL